MDKTNKWLAMKYDEVVGVIDGISLTLDKAEMGRYYRNGLSSQVTEFLEWTFVHHAELLRNRYGPGRSFDETGRLSDTRFRALDLIIQSLCQFTLFDSETGPKLNALSRAAERRCIGRWSVDDVYRAMSFRLSLSLLTFNHRWKMPLDYSLIKVAARKTFQDIYAFEMDEERQKQELEENPVLKAKLADEASRPPPYFYFGGKFTEHELKHNPALPAVFGIPQDEFDALCCYRLVEARSKHSDSLRGLCRLVAWQVFQNQFVFHVYSKHCRLSEAPSVETLEGVTDTRVLTNGIERFEEYVGTEVNFERDQSVRTFCRGLLFRLTSPFGFEEIYRADQTSNIDRYDPKLQYMCNQWLETSGRLYDGWFANMCEISEMTVDVALLQLLPASAATTTSEQKEKEPEKGWAYQAFFYEQFQICLMYHCQGMSMDKYVIFPNEALRRYKELEQETVSEFPPVERRPMIFCLGTAFYLCVHRKFYACESLAHACVSWVVVVMRLFNGQLEDRRTSVEPVYNLLVQKSRRKFGKPPPPPPRPAAAAAAPSSSSSDKTIPPLRMDIF
jgi:hypothetical protein